MPAPLRRTKAIYPVTSYRNPKNKKQYVSKANSSYSLFQPTSKMEYKNKESYSTAENVGYDVTLFRCVSDVRAGTDTNTMIGRKITLKSILVNYHMELQGFTGATLGANIPLSVRVIVVWDRESRGSVPLIADVLDISGNQAIVSPYNLLNTDRFKIIHDKTHPLGVYNFAAGSVTYSAVSGPMVADFSNTYKVNLPMEGPSTSAAGAGIVSGMVSLLAISNALDGTSSVTFNRAVRVRYIDA